MMMTLKRTSAVVVALLVGCCHAQSSGQSGPPLSLREYRSQLQDVSRQLDTLRDHPEQGPVVRASIPLKSVVTVNGREMEIRRAWLNEALVEYIAAKPEHKPQLLQQVQERLAAEQRQSELFSEPPAYPRGSREKLNEILSRREFRGVRGPTLWDQLRDRVINWIFRILDRIFRKVSYTPHGGQIVIWCVIAITLCVVAIWLKRTAAQRIEDWLPREPVPFSPSARHWKKWLAEAREAAQQGRWRDAVHLAYWAAISQLEQTGAWVPDRARTPREYLRLMPAGSERRPVLEALTRRFEVVWYGQRSVAARDFDDTLTELEKLGCR